MRGAGRVGIGGALLALLLTLSGAVSAPVGTPRPVGFDLAAGLPDIAALPPVVVPPAVISRPVLSALQPRSTASARPQLGCPPRRTGVHPVNGASVRPARPPTARAPMELMVAGDSMPEYAGRHLIARGGARGTLHACLETRYSTGLARPDFWNWGVYAHHLVNRIDPEAVVFMLGGNDCQNLWQRDGHLAIVGTKAWIVEYRRRAGQVMSTLTGQARRRLYWVGLPVARRADLAGCFRGINSAVKQASVGRPGVAFIDIWRDFAAADGQYADVIPDSAGRPVHVRQKDGVHLSYRGGAILAQRLLQLMNRDWHLTT